MPESSADKAPTIHAIPISPNMMQPIKMPKTPKIINSIQIAVISFSFLFALVSIAAKKEGTIPAAFPVRL